MIKKTVLFLGGVVVLTFLAIAVYAATDTGQTLTNDAGIANAEASSQACGRNCETCEDCDENCEECDDCVLDCKGHGEGRMYSGHGDGQGHKPGPCGGHGCGI